MGAAVHRAVVEAAGVVLRALFENDDPCSGIHGGEGRGQTGDAEAHDHDVGVDTRHMSLLR